MPSATLYPTDDEFYSAACRLFKNPDFKVVRVVLGDLHDSIVADLARSQGDGEASQLVHRLRALESVRTAFRELALHMELPYDD